MKFHSLRLYLKQYYTVNPSACQSIRTHDPLLVGQIHQPLCHHLGPRMHCSSKLFSQLGQSISQNCSRKTFILVYVGTVTIGLSLRRDRVFYSRALLVLSANVRLGIALLKHRVTQVCEGIGYFVQSNLAFCLCDYWDPRKTFFVIICIVAIGLHLSAMEQSFPIHKFCPLIFSFLMREAALFDPSL